MPESALDISLGILSRSRVFQVLPAAELEKLAARCSYERYRRGAPILRFGDTDDALVVFGRGRVKAGLASPDADGEIIVGLLWPGDVFGESVLFDREPKAVHAVALTETEALFVPRRELVSLIEKRPGLAIRLLESVCEKLRMAIELSVSIRFLDVQSRFYTRLLYLGRYDSRRDGDGVRIQHALSQRELADSIGVSREALNKLFGEWKRAGLLEYGRGYVVVKDPPALALRLPAVLRDGPLIEPSTNRPIEPSLIAGRRRRIHRA